MPADSRNSSAYRALAAKVAILAALAVTALVLPAGSASAQNGIFDSLFGRRPTSPANAYADPSPQFNPFNLFGSRAPEAQRPAEMGGAVAFCVRTCDGRFFPIQHHAGVTQAQACSSFCPASQTRIYNGSSIEQSVGPDGKRYAELATAFTYREKIVPGCTCNGRDAFGLVNTPVDEDPTLRPGDIVATNAGLMAYNGTTGSARKQAASYTPVASYSGLSGDLRRKLTETKIAPALETPAPPPQVQQGQVQQGDATPLVRNGKNKRVQVDR
jgi:Protein of unknown function (DUF2865)